MLPMRLQVPCILWPNLVPCAMDLRVIEIGVENIEVKIVKMGKLAAMSMCQKKRTYQDVK